MTTGLMRRMVTTVTAITAICTILGGAAMAYSDTVEATLNGLHLKLDSNTGSILEMSYPGVGKMMDISADRASLLDCAYPTKVFEPLRLASRYSTGAKVEKTADTVTVTWEKFGMSRAMDVSGSVWAQVTLKAAPDGQSVIISANIDNRSKNSIRQVLFPDFLGLIPFAGEEKTVFRSGGVANAPFVELKPVQGSGNTWPYMSSLTGRQIAAGGVYNPMIIRWFDFGSIKGGFSLFPKTWGGGAEDVIYQRRYESDGKLRMAYMHSKEIKPGEKWSSDEFVLTPHTGGWAKGIEPYRAWVKQNYERICPVPPHVRDGLGKRMMWMFEGGYGDPNPKINFTLADLPKIAKESKDCGIEQVDLVAWGPFFRVPLLPPYPELGSWDDLAKSFAESRRMGVNLSLMLSIMSLSSPSLEKYGGKVAGGGNWTYHTELVPMFAPYYGVGYESGGPPGGYANKEWHDDIISSIKHLKSLGISSLLWDQFINYPEVRTLGQEIRDILSKDDPEHTFASESLGNFDAESKYLDYTWNWSSYRDARPTTSVFPTPRIDCGITWDKGSALNIRRGFADNLYLSLMPRKPNGVDGSAWFADCPEISSTLKQCAKLRKQFLKYFTEGKLIGECLLTEDCPDAHVSTYILPDRALTFVVRVNGEGPLSLKCDLAPWLNSPSGKFEVKTFDVDGKLVNSGLTKSNWSPATPTLKSPEMVVYEVVAR